MEESVSGFKVRGGWVDVVEHGERLVRALRDVAEREDVTVDEAALHEFDEWRPKTDERLDDDVSEKTAAQASVDEGWGEKEGKAPDEDLQTAGEKLGEAYEKIGDDPDEAVDKWGESIDYVTRAADSAGRKAIRTVEDAVYRNVMTRIAPYYFDNELISANLRRVNGEEGPDYVFEVNITDDDVKIHVSNQLAAFEDVDRWHVSAPKETQTAEAAEGVEVSAREREPSDGPELDEKTT